MKRTRVSTPANNGKGRPDEQPDPFRFGWRYVQQIGSDGSKASVQVPLTLDEVLHPRESDHIPEHSDQQRDRSYLAAVLEYYLADDPHTLVLSDCLIDWGVRGLGNHSPDVSVFDGVQDKNRGWGTFYVAVEGSRPVLTIEIVSPDAHDRQARDNDVVTKVREYYRARVPLYVIVDRERREGPRRLIGYQRGTRRYVPVPLDDRGRLLLKPLRLELGLRDGIAVCWDADTGEEIGNLTAMAQARDAEAEARRVAESTLAAEAEARRVVESTLAAEAEARRAAESALAAAQARILELEARSRDGGGTS